MEKKELEEYIVLSKEFSRSTRVHKIAIIYTTLSTHYNSIYNNYLLEEYGELEGKARDKAKQVVLKLLKNEDLFEKVYDICWTIVQEELR